MSSSVEEELPQSWSDIRLDGRISEAINDLKWHAPMPVQRACIPHALRGCDVSLQSRTGSGKTGAFVIPVIQRLLVEREAKKRSFKPFALILVPSIELCEQTVEATQALCKYVKPRILVDNVAAGGSVSDQRIQSADLVVSTAAALAKYLKKGSITSNAFAPLNMLVIDEVDMLMNITERSLRLVQTILPTTLQVIMCSATLTEGVAIIKGQLLHNPVHISMVTEDETPSSAPETAAPVQKRSRSSEDATASNAATDAIIESHITLKDTSKKTLKQFYLVATDECHKHTLLFGLYRLQLINGKTIIFMDEEQETYHLEHFLQQLGIACVVYDVTLPTNARLDILRRFQRGEVGTLICTDNTLESAERMQLSLEGDEDEEGGETAAEGHAKKRRRVEAEPNSALHRGVDFNKVKNVIIFDGIDAPSAINFAKYTHRIGRTGRAGQEGNSFLFFNMNQTHKVLPTLRDHVKSKGDSLRPFKKMDRREAAKLQYRVDTVLSNITRNSTRKLRVATVASELARSSYLSTHMSQRDTETLQRLVKRSSKTVRCDKNVLDLPNYMGIKADDADTYADRVNLRGPRKEQAFAAITRRKSSDPLREVVNKVRQEKRHSLSKKR